jgi:pantoate--beta-alanine ligase
MEYFGSNKTDKQIIVFKSINEMIEFRKSLNQDFKIGFVPTMGYLHQGHLSLVKKAKSENDFVIVSIFVNPRQFGPGEDFEQYPRDLERDLSLLLACDVDCVFNPHHLEMYPDNYKTFIEVSDYSNIYCGASRPGHFKGVATIVNKLVNITRPNNMYMGEKDFQQVVVLKTMLKDLNIDTEIVSCPIIRETDGLAMSSRNIYLSQNERKYALCLSHSLYTSKELVKSNVSDLKLFKDKIFEIIKSSFGIIDYVAFIDNDTFTPVSEVNSNTRILLAVKIGNTRLIDNMLMS